MQYESRQSASWTIVLAMVLGAVGVALAVAGTTVGGAGLAVVGFGLVLVALLISSFASLTVRVTAEEVCWSFGMGLFRRRIPLARVRDVEVRRSAWYWGWGIRWTPRGWLWRAGGLDAVWLELEGGKRVGVGSPDPEGLARAVRAASQAGAA